jgi:hypothetical protein
LFLNHLFNPYLGQIISDKLTILFAYRYVVFFIVRLLTDIVAILALAPEDSFDVLLAVLLFPLVLDLQHRLRL